MHEFGDLQLKKKVRKWTVLAGDHDKRRGVRKGQRFPSWSESQAKRLGTWEPLVRCSQFKEALHISPSDLPLLPVWSINNCASK